jgi:hypothetical protein
MSDPTKKPTLSKWQQSIKKLWEKAAIQPEFQNDLVALQAKRVTVREILQGKNETVSSISAFMDKYKLPAVLFQVIDSYLYSGTIDFSLVKQPIEVYPKVYKTLLESLVSPPDPAEAAQFFEPGRAVYLRINPEIHNRRQLHDYIDRQWQDIEAKLKTTGHRKVTVRPDTGAEVNQIILELNARKGFGAAKIARALTKYQADYNKNFAPGVTFTTESVSETLTRLKNRTNF